MYLTRKIKSHASKRKQFALIVLTLIIVSNICLFVSHQYYFSNSTNEYSSNTSQIRVKNFRSKRVAFELKDEFFKNQVSSSANFNYLDELNWTKIEHEDDDEMQMYIYSSFAIVAENQRLLTIKINGHVDINSFSNVEQNKYWCEILFRNGSNHEQKMTSEAEIKKNKANFGHEDYILLITCQFNIEIDFLKRENSLQSYKLPTNFHFMTESKIGNSSKSSSERTSRTQIRISRTSFLSEHIDRSWFDEINPEDQTLDQNNFQLKSPKSVICVRPLYGPYSSLISLAQFIAYYKINQISEIIIYREETTSMVDVFLANLYPFVRLIQINIPLEKEGMFNSNYQSLTLHDCHRRFPDSIQLHVDIDEFIYSKKFQNLSNFLTDRFKSFIKTGKPVASDVPMVLFCNEMNENRSFFNDIALLKSFMRQVNPWPCPCRAKPVVFCPDCVIELGIHSTREPSLRSPLVWCENDALIYHYRPCNSSSTDTPIQSVQKKRSAQAYQKYDKGFMIDESMTNFHHEIIKFINFYLEL